MKAIIEMLIVLSSYGVIAHIKDTGLSINIREAKAFLTRSKRSGDCTDEVWCEQNVPYCTQHFEDGREEYCRPERSPPCPSSTTCYLSQPCYNPVHPIETACTIDLCMSYPCESGGTCSVVNGRHHCQCVPGYDPATDCATDIAKEQHVSVAQSHEVAVSHLPEANTRKSRQARDLPINGSMRTIPSFRISVCHELSALADLDECQSNPCLNGGSCSNLFNAFSCSCTDRYFGTTCEKDCRPGPADIVFVLDTSCSVGNDVNRSIDFIDEFVRKVPIGPSDFQIGVITYNFDPIVVFDLNDYLFVTDMLTELRKIKGEDAATFTAPALKKAAEMLSSSSMGARAGVSSYIILLYDGLSSDRNDAVTEATSIRSIGGRIITVGIGRSITHSEMLKISGHKYYTFSPLHLEDLYSRMMWETVHTDCTDCSLQKDTDVIILLDTSNNQTVDGYQDRLTAIRRTVEKVLNYNPNARIGMYSYADQPEEVFSLSWSSDKDKLIAAALQVNIEKQISQSNTSHVLQHIRTSNYFSSARKLIVILSDGNWKDDINIKTEIQLLEQNGVKVFGVIAGEDCNVDNYNDIILDRSQLFSVFYGDSTSLESFAAMTTFYRCQNHIFTLRQ